MAGNTKLRNSTHYLGGLMSSSKVQLTEQNHI